MVMHKYRNPLRLKYKYSSQTITVRPKSSDDVSKLSALISINGRDFNFFYLDNNNSIKIGCFRFIFSVQKST